jgi:Ca2+-binding EF-hand superfamily protein
MQADSERFFGLLDVNHDGEIDPDEITRYEVDVAPRERVGLLDLPEPVVSADMDFNRGVSLDEFRKAAAKRFQALDVDHRGVLTLSVLEDLGPARSQRPHQPQADADSVLPE